jgi:hypothetical protein
MPGHADFLVVDAVLAKPGLREGIFLILGRLGGARPR